MILRKREFEELVDHCRGSSPVEACGVLVGMVCAQARLVKRVFKARNVLNSPSAYQIDPEELLRFFLQAERDSMEMLGFYHSHPFWAAKPSRADESSAYYPGYSYLIYSIPLNELRSYVWKGNKFVSESVEIVRSLPSSKGCRFG